MQLPRRAPEPPQVATSTDEVAQRFLEAPGSLALDQDRAPSRDANDQVRQADGH